MLAEAGTVAGLYAGSLIAAGANGSNFDPSSLLTYGITPTAVALLLIFRWLVPGPTFKAVDAERRELQRTLLDPTILQRNSQALEQVARLIETEVHVRRVNPPPSGG